MQEFLLLLPDIHQHQNPCFFPEWMHIFKIFSGSWSGTRYHGFSFLNVSICSDWTALVHLSFMNMHVSVCPLDNHHTATCMNRE